MILHAAEQAPYAPRKPRASGDDPLYDSPDNGHAQ